MDATIDALLDEVREFDAGLADRLYSAIDDYGFERWSDGNDAGYRDNVCWETHCDGSCDE